MSETNTILRIREMRKRLGDGRILTAESFSVNAGECTLLFGDNGGGKTTLLKILAGLLAPDSCEEWRLDGRVCKPGRGGRADGVVLLHQTPYMFSASARTNVARAAKEPARADLALAWAGLSHAADSPARALSGGEQARISLARAYAAEMKLCLMDEPAAHLDGAGIALAADLIENLRRRGAAVIVAAPAKTNTIPYDRLWRLQDGTLREEREPPR